MRILHQPQNLSLAEFVAKYAKPGCIGLIGGGSDAMSKAIQFAQRGITQDGHSSLWSHAFLFIEKRADGRQWILESDLDTHKGHIRWGVQENRADKYYDPSTTPAMAILDLELSPEKTRAVIAAGLDLLVNKTRYPLRELLGTLATMRIPSLRAKDNPFKQDNALYCSAMVAHCFKAAGINLEPQVTTKHTAPEDLWHMTHNHNAYLWQAPPTKVAAQESRVRTALKNKVHRAKAAVRARRTKIKSSLTH